MFPPVIAYRNSVGGSQGVVTLGGGTPKQLGDDVVGSIETVSADSGVSHNRVVWFRGCLYVVNTSGVYCLDSSGTGIGSWTQVYTYDIAINNSQHHIGSLHVWSGQDGSKRLYFMYLASTNVLNVVSSINGTDWDDAGNSPFASASISFYPNGTVWGGAFYSRIPLTLGAVRCDAWSNLATGLDERSFGDGTSPITAWTTNNRFGGFIVSDENLYYIGTRGSGVSDLLRIYENYGSSFEEVFEVPIGTYRIGVSTVSSRNLVCFPDPVTDRIFYVLTNGRHSGDTVQGTVCLKVDLTGTGITVTDVGDDVLPSSIRTSSSFGWWSVFVDDVTDPVNPVVYFGYTQSADLGENWGYYRFVDDSSEAVLEATIPFGYAMPYGNLSSGFRINQLDSTFQDVGSAELGRRIIADDGSLQFEFEVFGGLTGLTGNLYWGLKGEIPTNLAVLTGTPSGGSISRVGDDLLGIDGDGTLYTAFWDFSANGFLNADDVNLKLVVG